MSTNNFRATRSLVGGLIMLALFLPLRNPAEHASASPIPQLEQTNYIWSFEAADAPIGTSTADLRIDSADNLHVALGGDHLYYAASNDGLTWEREVVDSSAGAGQGLSLALDSSGSPQIAYIVNRAAQQTTFSTLKYALKSSGQWTVETVAVGDGIGRIYPWVSLAIDSLDRPHIVYRDEAGGLKHATRIESQWVLQVIDNQCSSGPISMGIDSNGSIYVSYYCSGVRMARWDGTQWTLEIIESSSSSYSEGTALLLDSIGLPHVTYVDYESHQLKYARWNGSNWDISTVAGSASGLPAIVLNGSAQPRIMYRDTSNSVTSYAKYDGALWSLQTAPSNPGDLILGITLATNTLDEPRAVYVSRSGIKYIQATINNGLEEWSQPSHVVDPPPARVGAEASLTTDSNGNPHTSYLDMNQMQLRYAHWTGSAWDVQVVDTLADWHVYPSIKTDAAGYPHIAYFGVGGLTLASWDGTTWTINSVSGLAGRYTSLAVDGSGKPHIAFCGGGVLKYASWDGAAWLIEVVDSDCGGGDFGGEISLTVDGTGIPRIAYNAGTENFVKMAAWNSATSSWMISSLGEYGIGVSQALDGTGNPHIAFCSPGAPPTGGQIRYASWNGTGWDIVTAGTGNCQVVSLAIGGDDIPHVAFPDYHFDSLEHIYWDGITWQKQRLQDGILTTGFNLYTPVAADALGTPWIAFSSWLDGDHWLAKGTKTSNPTPANDQFLNATLLETLPYSTSLDTGTATTYLSDPVMPCTNDREKNTVWFKYIPTRNGKLLVDTLGSNYDTVLGLWTLQPGHLTSLACNNDSASTLQSQFETFVEQGTTYYIEVASRTSEGGQLVLNAGYIPCYELTLTIYPAGSGTAAASPAPTCPGGQYFSGTQVQLNAYPSPGGYKFKSWSNSTYSQTNPFTIIMDNDRMVDANFNLPPAPGIPSLLSPASNLLVTDYTPRLDWANVSLPTGTFFGHYQIEIDNNSDFSSREVVATTIEGDIAKSDFTPTEDLAPNTRYYWHVRSYNSAGVASAWSASRYFRTAMLPPTLVEPLDTAPIDNKRPMLQWAEVEGASSYTVEAAINENFSIKVFSVTVSSTSYTRTADLLPNKLYYWRVRANGLNGPSLYSEVYSFTTGNPPSIPVLSAPASNMLVTNYSPLLDWRNVTVPAGTEFKYYRVQTATNSAFTTDLMEYTTVEGLVGDSSLSPVPSLAPNKKFYWRVRAENTDGQYSAWSASRYFRTALTPPASLTPGSVIPEPPVPIYSRRPTFSWEPAPDAAGYTVEYSTAQTFATKISVSTTKTSLIPAADLLANKVYYWRVKATGTNGPSAPSQVRTFMTGNPPATPVLSSPATGTLLSPPVLFNWANSTVPAGTSFDHYQIQVATDNAFDNIIHDNSLPGLSNSQDNTAPLAAGTTYYWRVCAWNIVNGTENHSSAWSAVRSVRIKYAPPTLEMPEEAATAISRMPTFDWNDTTGATSYTLQVSTSPSFGTFVINKTLTSSTYTHLTNLLANKTYYWRVRVNGSHGPSNWSPFFTFTTTP